MGSSGSDARTQSGWCGGQRANPGAPLRTDTLLDDGWRFTRSDVAGASATTFDDSRWTAIAVPHTWNNLDGQDGGSNYYRGVGSYRRHYMPPADAAGKKIYLQFDGANIVADVYVNGTLLGQHRGGFGRFRFDDARATRDRLRRSPVVAGADGGGSAGRRRDERRERHP